MKSQKVNPGDSILASQYNNLRDDAKKSSQFLASQQTTPNMTLKVEAGTIIINGTLLKYNGGNSPTFTAPTSNPRIDLLALNSSGTLEIIQGTESATPSPPSYPTDKFVICEVYHRVGETSIKDEDDGTNGYIYRDSRAYVANFQTTFGGNGSDGDLIISSGTTNIDLGGQKVFIKNYNSISITGTGQLTFSNPHNNGTLIIFKSKGNVTITSTANPAIDLRNLGGAGGGVASNGLPCSSFYGSLTTGGLAGSSNGTYASGGGGGAGATTDGGNGGSHGSIVGGAGGKSPLFFNQIYPYNRYPIIPGSGGGSGGFNSGAYTQVGGRGAGAIYIECGGSLNITSIINASGSNGGNAPSGFIGGGGGGGGGGSVVIIYKSLTANTASVNVSGGTGGTGQGGGAGGGSGGNGIALIAQYQEV
jgi:hypothetical protein